MNSNKKQPILKVQKKHMWYLTIITDCEIEYGSFLEQLQCLPQLASWLTLTTWHVLRSHSSQVLKVFRLVIISIPIGSKIFFQGISILSVTFTSDIGVLFSMLQPFHFHSHSTIKNYLGTEHIFWLNFVLTRMLTFS